MSAVEYWDGTGVTPETLEFEVRRLAALRPDHVYDAETYDDLSIGSKCKYTHSNLDGSKVAGCIVGQAIFNITGKLVDQSTYGGGVLDFPFMQKEHSHDDEGYGRWSDRAKFLANVQYHQDSKMSWGNAVITADDTDHPSNWWRPIM